MSADLALAITGPSARRPAPPPSAGSDAAGLFASLIDQPGGAASLVPRPRPMGQAPAAATADQDADGPEAVPARAAEDEPPVPAPAPQAMLASLFPPPPAAPARDQTAPEPAQASTQASTPPQAPPQTPVQAADAGAGPPERAEPQAGDVQPPVPTAEPAPPPSAAVVQFVQAEAAPPPLPLAIRPAAPQAGARSTAAKPATGVQADLPAAAATAGPEPAIALAALDGEGETAAPDPDGAPAAAAEADPGAAAQDPAVNAQPAPAGAQAVSSDPAPVATPGTATRLAAQIVKQAGGKTSRFDVQLDPHGLGGVAVSVEIDARGRLTAALTFDRPESAEALKAQSGVLKAALESAGFDLSGGGLSFGARSGFTGGDDPGRNQPRPAPAGPGRAFDLAALNATQFDQGTQARSARVRSGLDIRI